MDTFTLFHEGDRYFECAGCGNRGHVTAAADADFVPRCHNSDCTRHQEVMTPSTFEACMAAEEEAVQSEVLVE